MEEQPEAPADNPRPLYGTQEKKKESPQVEMLETYNKLNRTIDELEVHIEDAIKKHEAEFLFAYRNHMKKIKKELAELRRRSDDQEKEFSSNDRIVHLEKQIAIFREEALKLYDKVDLKTRENDELKLRLKTCEKENLAQQKDMKELIKRVKVLELQVQTQPHSDSQLEPQEPQESRADSLTKKSRYLPYIDVNRSLQSPANKALADILQPHVKEEALQAVVSEVNAYVRQKEAEFKERARRKAAPLALANSDNELKEWFLDCVRTMKKEIYKRKQQEVYSLANVDNISDFLAIDKLRLLELFLSDERLLSHMYLKMFPDRLAELTEFLAAPKREDKPSTHRNKSMVDRLEQYDFEELDKPTIVTRKVREPKSLLRNRVIIKNGKLNFSNF